MNKKPNYYFYKIFWLVILAYYPVFVKAEEGGKRCKGAFPSRLYFENQVKEKAVQDRKLHSEFVDPREEHKLQEEWNRKTNVPSILDFFLPNDVSYIGHQLSHPESVTAVKLVNRDAIMARASYQYNNRVFATNVAFSPRVLLSNMRNKDGKKWLVGSDASAAILFLHGMGMQTAGAHIARRTIRDFHKHFEDIHVLSLDLPWHAEGHREVLGSLSEEIMVLSAFVKKYIPPHVPLFIWGHSGGTVFAQRLMTMTDSPLKGTFFHPNLKGIMLFSPAVDAAPGKSREEKYKAFSEGQRKGMSELLSDRFVIKDPLEVQFFEDSNPLGELFGMWMITQLNFIMPPHKGRKYIPSFMAVGTKDPLTFVGFPRTLFSEYYDKLENMETHYFDRLPLLRTKNYEEVSHWLGEYMDPESGLPIQIALARQFMEKQLGITFEKTSEKTESSIPPFIDVIENFSNNLAFRKFFDQHRFLRADLNSDLQSLNQVQNQKINEQMSEILQKHDVEKKLRGKIMGKIFSSLDFGQLMEFLGSQSLPEQLLKEIADYFNISGYFKIKQLAQGIYLPDKNELLEKGFVRPEDQELAEFVLKGLSKYISERTQLIQELSVLEKRENSLKKHYQKVRHSVNLAIKLIGEAFKEASKNPPPSLTSAFRSIRNELEIVMELGNEIPRLFERLAVQMTTPSFSQMNDLIEKYVEEKVTHFRQLYHQYNLSRENLKRRLIRAISEGEMGQKYQQVVLGIYGQDLDGQGPLYLKLKDSNEELAQVEADIYNKKALNVKSLMRYQHEYVRLYPLLQRVKQGDTDWIDMGRNSYTFNEASVHDVLKRFSSQLLTEPTLHSYVGQRINSDYDAFFRNVLDTWEQFSSNPLPDLPVAQDNH